jgi:hypothetical protein
LTSSFGIAVNLARSDPKCGSGPDLKPENAFESIRISSAFGESDAINLILGTGMINAWSYAFAIVW